MAPLQRDQLFNVRLTSDERAMLTALAERDGVTASDWVRLTVRRAYAEAFGDKPPKRPE